MYVNQLDGARPVEWITKIEYCPRDCGGEEFDEIDYIPICPNCRRQFRSLDHDAYCRDCGTKLYWNINKPYFK